MGKFIDLTGEVINGINILKRVENDKHNKAQFLCECYCGNEFICVGTSLKSKNTRSCGCLVGESRTTHGGTGTKLYTVYHQMKRRCTKPNDKDYRHYGYRNIKVCEEWLESFVHFREWALANGYEKVLTLDRIDNDGDYSPENCRWADWNVQSNNRSCVIRVMFNGRTRTLSEISKETGVNHDTLHDRYIKGKPLIK